MPTFLISIFRNPWAIGAIAIILVGGIQQSRVYYHQSKVKSCLTSLAEQRQQWTEAESEGRKAAQEALEAALRRERKETAARVLAEQEAAQRAREAARDAQAETEAWRQRYRDALRDDPGCEAWSREVVACPVQ
jgi:LPS sulfotransferase NodH